MQTNEALEILAVYGQYMDEGFEVPDDLIRHYLHANAHMLRRGLIEPTFCTGKDDNKPIHMHCAPTEKFYELIGKRP